MVRKRRTRQHIIADLSVNFVELAILQCGYSMQRISADYGTDVIITTYDSNGEIENGLIFLQLKATDALPFLADQETIALKVKRSDLELWLHEPMPYILVLYDAQENVAYWLYLQAYFEQKGIEVSTLGETHTLHLKKQNILNTKAIKKFAAFKAAILQQSSETIHYEV